MGPVTVSLPWGTGVAAGEDAEAHRHYRHEALLWQDEEDFLAVTVPFVRDGVRAGQPVLVAVTADRLAAMRDTLGEDADPVRFVDMGDAGANPARIIPLWRAFLDDAAAGGQAVRGIGEPIWSRRSPEELVECQLHEALLNQAVESTTPLWLLCPYDVTSLGPDVLAEADRSHPVIVDRDSAWQSPTYAGAAGVVALWRADLPPAPASSTRRRFGVGELPGIREDVATLGTAAGLPSERVANLVLAVNEVATNSLRHGNGGPVLRTWCTPVSLVCEIHDDGQLHDPMSGRAAPALDADHGRGLWIANQLSDLVQVRSGDFGTRVRIHAWR